LKVITMDMIGKVRRMHYRDRFSYSDIARRTGLPRNTVRKWLKAPVKVEPKYRRGKRPTKLTAHHEALTLALKADAHRPKHERRTAKALYAEIKAAGYEGGYSRVTDFIRAWRAGVGQSVASAAFVPLAFELGEAFQFDWSEEALVVGGIYYRLQVAHMKLCASRAFWLVAYPSQGHEMLFDAHTRSFAALGGIARRGMYDFVAGNKIVQQHPGHAGEDSEGQHVTAQEAVHPGVQEEAQEDHAAVAEHHHEGHQGAAGAADL
jgi:transposase